jgi:predicted transcriptional regulator
MDRKKEDYTAGVGGRVRQLLIDRGISVQKWADHLNVTPAHCYQVIQGRRSLTLETITVRIKPGASKEDIRKRVNHRLNTILNAREAARKTEGE